MRRSFDACCGDVMLDIGAGVSVLMMVRRTVLYCVLLETVLMADGVVSPTRIASIPASIFAGKFSKSLCST